MAVKPRKTALAGHTAGIFADMTLDGPEIGTLVAVVDRARNLPNRKTMGKQDPYCAMRLGKEARKTDTDRRGGQTPKWDQELRFTVHESPDYYKLKCSVFNDDKRTDLIGEAFIDLSDLIKPGGGSNDLWHNLNYKGKYAGDVRIELTYYDLRPREEKTTEKKKPRERTPIQDKGESLPPAPRQLGPREVRRRPLPSSPANSTPTQTPPPAPLPLSEVPTVPPKVPASQDEESYSVQDQPPQREQQIVPASYTGDLTIVQPPVQQYRQPFCEDPSPSIEHQIEPAWNGDYEQSSRSSNQSPHASVHASPLALTPSSQPDESEFWEQHRYLQSQPPRMSNTDCQALSRALPSPPVDPQELQYQSSRSNTSLVKHSQYRDSPLRQSISQHETHMQVYDEPESYDAPPPPPPMHRETPPRRAQQEYPPSSFPHHDRGMVSFAPRPLEATTRRRSIDDDWSRRQADSNQDFYPPISGHTHEPFDRYGPQGSRQDRQMPQVRRSTNDHHHTPERQTLYSSYQGQASPISQHSPRETDPFIPEIAQIPAYQKPVYREQSESHDHRRLSGHIAMSEDYHVATSQSNSQPGFPSIEHHKLQSSQHHSSSSTPNHIPSRKAISPGSHPQPDGRRLSATPYGPDAYDVLNPATGPVTNDRTIFQSSEQAKESARLREVEKLRDQGPIIGNDGRVIDPSDHLPSDTWAPEPERKTRRPEHVVRVRTKNEIHSHTIPNSLSSPAQNNYRRQGPASNAPFSAASSVSPSGERHRLQKQPPARPLPVQPYPHAHSEPRSEQRMEANHSNTNLNQHAVERYSHHGSPQGLHRPQLSEYQVPASNSYIPRGSTYHDSYSSSSPSRGQMQMGREQSSTYAKSYDDPLAAEMNMIDIGPSRGGQVVLSNRRAY